MKQVWVKVIPWEPELARAAIESGADALWIEPGKSAEAKKIGIVRTVAQDGDLKLGIDVVEREVREKRDEEEILSLSLSKTVVVKSRNWMIIPLENLLCRTDRLFVEIYHLHEGETAFSILEKGVHGVVIHPEDPEALRQLVRSLKKETERIGLLVAKVSRLEPLGLGDRVCVDTCSTLSLGEGILVGNTSQALFLVHAENVENPFIPPRPFRVNAGPVHAYIRMANGETRYLSEVKCGDKALIVNFEGKSYPAVVGRAKVERRPLIMIEAEVGGERFSTILQNAETIRLTQPEGKPISLVDLKEGSEVLVYREATARHAGIAMDETIVER